MTKVILCHSVVADTWYCANLGQACYVAFGVMMHDTWKLTGHIFLAITLQVTEQELQNALMNRMRQFPGQEKMVIDYYRKNPGAMMELRGPIFEQKVVDGIVAKAKVSDKTVSKDELQAMVQDEDDVASA